MSRGNPMQRRPGGFPGEPRFPRPNDRSTLSTPAPQEPENRKANKSLYRIGDKVAGTDYVIKNIIMEENKVILERGGVETVLILDEKNTNSSIRRERVKNEEMAVRAKYAQKAQASTPVTQMPQQGIAPPQPGMGTPQRSGFPGQPSNPNGSRPGMSQRTFVPGQGPGQGNSQPVQQNPTSGMPPLPPTMPGQNNSGVQQNNSGVQENNNNNTGNGANSRPNIFNPRYSPIPQRLVD